MKINHTKGLAIAVITLPLLGVALFGPAPAPTHADDTAFDAAAFFKTKCAMCHTATAGKYFDGTKPDAELVQTVLKGKTADKPPSMPSYEAKGVTEDQAKALVAYMKSLKS